MKSTETADPCPEDDLTVSDEQIDRVCEGLVQNAAKVRFLKRLGLAVSRRPNGKPLVARIDWDRLYSKEQKAPPAEATSGPRWQKTEG